MTARDQIAEIRALLDEAETDADKFVDSGVDAAGRRLRAAFLNISKICKTARTEIQEQRNKG